MQDLKEKLEAALKAHDWHFARSDDHNVWMRGQRAWDRIQALASQLGEDGQELIAKYKR